MLIIEIVHKKELYCISFSGRSWVEAGICSCCLSSLCFGTPGRCDCAGYCSSKFCRPSCQGSGFYKWSGVSQLKFARCWRRLRMISTSCFTGRLSLLLSAVPAMLYFILVLPPCVKQDVTEHRFCKSYSGSYCPGSSVFMGSCLTIAIHFLRNSSAMATIKCLLGQFLLFVFERIYCEGYFFATLSIIILFK